MKVQNSSAYQTTDLPLPHGKNDQIFRHLLNILPVAVYTCDKSGYITYYNQCAADIWGRQPQIGKDLWCGSYKILNADGNPVPLDQCPMAITLKTGQEVSNH